MCYMLAAGKKATVDGSVLIGRSCDTISTMAARIIHRPAQDHPVPSTLHIPSTLPDHPGVDIPQVAHTYAFTASAELRPDWDYPLVLGGINEHQLCAGASTGGMVRDEVEALTPWPHDALGDFIMTLVLERCKTAREAVRMVGDLTEQYGARGDIYTIGDKDEVWVIEQYQGYHWAAARVPDDKFVIMANCFRIGEMDLNDPDNFMGSPDLITFAQENGLWDPAKGPFHASLAYGTREMPAPRNYPSGYTGSSLRSHGNQLRVWGGIKGLKPSADIDPLDPSRDYQLFWEPDNKLDINDILGVLKSYYAGTDMDEYKDGDEEFRFNINSETGRYRLAPAWGKARLIGCPNQSTSWVCKIRGDLPKPLQATIWIGLGSAPSVPHVPYFALSEKVPPQYQKGWALEDNRYEKDSAYWLYTNISNLKNLFYQPLVDVVNETWADFEGRAQEHHAQLLQRACCETDPEGVVRMITDFAYQHALEAYQMGEDLMEEVFTRIALLNNPHTVLQYQDPKKWVLKSMVH